MKSKEKYLPVLVKEAILDDLYTTKKMYKKCEKEIDRLKSREWKINNFLRALGQNLGIDIDQQLRECLK